MNSDETLSPKAPSSLTRPSHAVAGAPSRCSDAPPACATAGSRFEYYENRAIRGKAGG